MSHYTVMVIGDDVHGQLAPYQENNMGDCPEEFLEFCDQTDDLNKEWENADEELKTKYPTLEKFATEYNGYKPLKIDGETLYGYYENPNAKWDWYQVGGRWSGFLRLKQGATGEQGQRSWMNEGKQIDSKQFCDSARKGDIDFDGMRQSAGEFAAQQYDAATAAIAGRDFKTWKQVVEEVGEIDKARAVYHAQEPIKAFKEMADADKSGMFGFFSSADDYKVDRDTYIAEARAQAISTYAILKDGVWYAKGEMGWFGMSDDSLTEAQWAIKVGELIDGLSDDTPITIVDCHI